MNPTDYERIESAIRYLDDRVKSQPSLDELAEHIGLSKYHLHRLFSRWAGVTPKRFLEFLTVEHAKDLLRRSESVLSTAYRTGLSGPARLHDHFVAVEAATPGEYKTGGAGLTIRHGVAQSPFGPVFVAQTDRGICRFAFLPEGREGVALERLRSEWWGASLIEQNEAVEATVREVFQAPFGVGSGPITLHLRGTNFQLSVWQALLSVSPGALTTYGRLAADIGRPSAARAVGTAVGRNDLAFVIPCHRVIQATGRSGGYRWGTVRKRSMLAWEASRAELSSETESDDSGAIATDRNEPYEPQRSVAAAG